MVSHLASLRDPRSRDAGTSWFDDDESAGDPIAKFSSEIDERLTQRASHSGREPNQDNSGVPVSARIGEQTEVLVSVRSTRASERANASTTSSSTPGLISRLP